MRIGVDTGGTFTDCVVFEGSQIKILKVFSTPDDAARAILDGVRRVAGDRAPGILDIIHGTTVGTNSLLERRGARVAMVTTAGFEDVIEIGRQARPRLYDLDVRREPPLVPRALRWGVKERTGARGKILSRPRPRELARLRNQIKRSGAESIALCLLFSFANPVNERIVVRALRNLGIPISVSHQILPEFREYERLSTVVINAFLAPRLGQYLARLEHGAGEAFSFPRFKVGEGSALPRAARGRPSLFEIRNSEIEKSKSTRRVFVMQSSGGITTAARAAREPVRTLLSGPAGGVVGAAWLVERLGIRRALSFDMGGTSTDVCLLDGRPRTTHETTLGGLPVAMPVLDVHSVGAGGGSLARIDAGGALRVGPESSGAVPGPVCYGRGGALPTVTDANLLLGRLDADHFLGGTFRLDARVAERAFAEFLRPRPGSRGSSTSGGKAFRTTLELAGGIVAVVNANMERALRVVSVERGHDPRDFALISFGGAGGLHAADLARSLGMAKVIVPQSPGAFSALGILLSDIVKDVSQSVLLPVPGVVPRPAGAHGGLKPGATSTADFRRFFHGLERQFEGLERHSHVELRREGFPAEIARPARINRWLDVRYVGQAYELTIPFSAEFRNRFHGEHEQAYGYAQWGSPIEVVNLRLRLTIRTRKPQFETGSSKLGTRNSQFEIRKSRHAVMIDQKPVWFGGRFWPTPFYDRDLLRPGASLAGPAVLVEYSSTTVVPPDQKCHVDEYRNLVLSSQ